MHFLAYLLVPQIVSALAISQRDTGCAESTQLRALYMLDSNPSGSSVAAFKINVEDGSLSDQVNTPTGQLGALGLLLDLPTLAGPPAVAPFDPLYSQNAIIVHNNYLFTVNAGSNSVSMFLIDPKDPTHPTLINSAPSLGVFPNAVAYSAALKTACVVNGGIIAGVTCYSVDHAKGLTPITALLPLAITQTNPPIGPFNTTSDIQFSPDNTYLLVTVKGASFTDLGFNYIYPIVAGKVSTTPIVNTIPGLHLNFGFSFLDNGRAIITDFPGSYDIVTIDPAFNVTLDVSVSPVGATGLCWTVYSPRFDVVVISEPFNPNITLVDPTTGALKGVLVQEANEAMGSSLDMAIDRNYLYALQGTNRIAVSNLTGLNSKGTANITLLSQFQALDVAGVRTGFTGLAVYPSS